METNIMDILKKEWNKYSLSDKIGFALDLVTSIGGGMIGSDLGKHFSEGHKPIAKFFIRFTCAGLGTWIGNTAGQTLKESYTGPIKRAEEKAAEKNDKEEEGNGYTRY